MSLSNLADELAAAARDLSADDVGQTLEKAVGLAVELIDGCDACGVTLVRRGDTLETPAYTDEKVFRGDQLQYELNEGPCMDAAWQHEMVFSADLGREARWPRWAPRVVEELGAHSMLCVQLFTDAHVLGALNLYSWKPGAFTSEDSRGEALALAAHVAVALAAAQEISHLTTALGTRTVIGQAVGILMERFGLTADRSFEVLQRVSSQTNTKLLHVAQQLVETRRLPGSATPSTIPGRARLGP
jgi:GAF domain-containing protein